VIDSLLFSAITSITLGNFNTDAALTWLLTAVIFLANLAGGIVVGVATIRGLFLYVTSLIRDRGEDIPKESIRLSIGRSLTLALEFQVGADILSTAREPTQRDIIVLGAIVILRTALNFFLQRELREAQKQSAVSPPMSDSPDGHTSRPAPSTTNGPHFSPGRSPNRASG
jgi:uncharacterized membrane protein